MGNARNIAFWVVLFLLILALFYLFSGPGSTMQSREISYSEFVEAVESGEVSNVTLDGEQVRFRQSDGTDYVTIKPTDAEITQLLIAGRASKLRICVLLVRISRLALGIVLKASIHASIKCVMGSSASESQS